MSDVMLFGVLRMPYEMAMSSELSRRQFYERAQEAANRLERLSAAEWMPIEAAPRDSGLLLVYTPDDGDGERFDFDYREDEVWVVHAESYEHFMAVGGMGAVPDCVCTGPSEDAPYTHFAVLSPPTDRRTPEVE